MTKREFLNITHRRTNNKIKKWLKSHTPNNVILRYLWIALSLLIGVIAATVGCATYIVTWLIIDVEYDIKYMEVEIEVLGLSPTEAHEYIKKKEQEFNRLGASQFSTLSAKRGRKIEKALKYLYSIYPATPVVEDDTKHNEVIDKISDVEQGLSAVAEDTKQILKEDTLKKVLGDVAELRQDVTGIANDTKQLCQDDTLKNVHSDVAELRQDVTGIANDTKQLCQDDTLKNVQSIAVATFQNTELIKDSSTTIEIKESVDKIVSHNQQEEAEKIKSQQKRDAERREAELRQGHRTKGRKFTSSPTNMESRLSEEQTIILLDHINSMNVFARHITRIELEDIFLCIHPEPLRVTHNKIVTILFDRLAAISLISPKWRRVADHNKCFESKTGKLLSSKDLSAAYQKASLIDPQKAEMINECIEDIMSAK